jgi:hypothetical protein
MRRNVAIIAVAACSHLIIVDAQCNLTGSWTGSGSGQPGPLIEVGEPSDACMCTTTCTSLHCTAVHSLTHATQHSLTHHQSTTPHCTARHCTHSHTPPMPCSIRPLTHSFSRSFAHLIYPRAHLPTHPLTHPLTHSLTQLLFLQVIHIGDVFSATAPGYWDNAKGVVSGDTITGTGGWTHDSTTVWTVVVGSFEGGPPCSNLTTLAHTNPTVDAAVWCRHDLTPSTCGMFVAHPNARTLLAQYHIMPIVVAADMCGAQG